MPFPTTDQRKVTQRKYVPLRYEFYVGLGLCAITTMETDRMPLRTIDISHLR